MPVWAQILITVIPLLTLEGIIQFFFIKVRKKNQQIQNVDAEVAVAQHANELLSNQLERSHETIQRKDEQISELERDKASLLATQACLFDDMCIHKGCRVRKPHQGQGSKWYEKYREDPNLGADYTSIDTLLKLDRASRLRAEVQADAVTPAEGETKAKKP